MRPPDRLHNEEAHQNNNHHIPLILGHFFSSSGTQKSRVVMIGSR